MASSGSDKCFVVMPFGKKQTTDGSGGTYDFDKVYRVIMQPAIRQAGMEPIRADETKGSRIIHTDMFKDLRDQPVVLVDLSLNNPNVFYELGIRHVMSSRGTVLMCRAGQVLPFDVKLSRTLFYEFDGESLDWEVAEETIELLQAQLEETRTRMEADSPVHTLLVDRVLSEVQDDSAAGPATGAATAHGLPAKQPTRYHKLVAEYWAQQGLGLDEVRKEALDSAFGVRAFGYYALDAELRREEAVPVATILYEFEQYDLANRIYEQFEDELEFEDALTYASSLTEATHTPGAAAAAIEKVEQVLTGVAAQRDTKRKLLLLARGHHTLAGLSLWRWQLSQKPADLIAAIEKLEEADHHHEQALRKKVAGHWQGKVALNKLKLMLALRIRDRDVGRDDVEGYYQQIMDLEPSPTPDEATSFLRWYQVIALADAGAARRSSERAMENVRYDDGLRHEVPAIGHRQYTTLRRFLEQWSRQLRDKSAAGEISRILKVFQQK